MSRLLVLDINGVLCYKSNQHFILRPFLKDFLKECYSKYDIGFFSSTPKDNVYKILNFMLTKEQFKKTKFISSNLVLL